MKYKIFIINLESEQARYHHAVAQFSAWPNLPIERVSAVNGKQLSPEQQACYSFALNQKHYHKILTPGEKGCFLSHITCWQKIVAEQLDFAIILEDDFIIQHAPEMLLDAISQLQQPWCYIKLAMPNKQQPILKRIALNAHFDLVDYAKMPVSTIAQVVSLQGATQLLANTIPFYRPVDVAIQHTFELGILAQGVDPVWVKPEFSFDSSINFGKKKIASHWVMYKNKLGFWLKNKRHNKTHYAS